MRRSPFSLIFVEKELHTDENSDSIPKEDRPVNNGVLWLASVNLIIWAGLFLYLLNLEHKIRKQRKES